MANDHQKLQNEADKAQKNNGKGELLPARLGDGNQIMSSKGKKPKTIKDVREQMALIYKETSSGNLAIEDATKLVYLLDKITQALKTETEIALIQNEYAEAWSGVNLRGPSDD